MSNISQFDRDIKNIAKIDAVPLILSMVKQTTGMRFATVARVTEANWVACAVNDSIDFGLEPGSELAIDTTFCNQIRQNRQPVIFKHASEHSIYATHPIPKLYQLESYVSVPIVRSNDEFFGTLCAIDNIPAHFDEETVLATLGLFAQLIGVQLDMQEAQEKAEIALSNEAETGRLREQFIAVLGHDLRSPLTAIGMSAELLEGKLTIERDRGLATSIKQSATRMGALIEDVLDFSRARMGGGIPVKRVLTDQLTYAFTSVINEVALSHPNVSIKHHIATPPQSFCDAGRMGQLLSNLLVNAVSHGSKESPVEVSAIVENGNVVLAVTNQGVTIPPAQMALLFHPFTRSEAGGRGEGLGLGLYIAAQIVAGHNGTLSVSSTPEAGTCFTARFPSLLEDVLVLPADVQLA